MIYFSVGGLGVRKTNEPEHNVQHYCRGSSQLKKKTIESQDDLFLASPDLLSNCCTIVYFEIGLTCS